MQYAHEINAFYNWLELNSLDAASIALWYALVHLAKKAGKHDNMAISVATLCAKAGLDTNSFYRARTKLVKVGRIRVVSPGGRNNAAYTIIPFADDENTDATLAERRQNDNILAGEETAFSQEDADEIQAKESLAQFDKERNEEEREKKERSKERKEREEAKRENIPPYPPRGECEGGEKANSENNKPVCLAKPGENAKPAGEGVQGKGGLEGNSYLVHPQEQEGRQGAKEELGDGMAEEREKKESRRERKEKEAASSGKRAAKPKYFLSLAEAHQAIDRRLAGKSDALAVAMKEWATMRYALRRDGRMTERAIDSAFEFFNKRRYDERQAIRCVQQSIDHLWIGLFDIQGGGA